MGWSGRCLQLLFIAMGHCCVSTMLSYTGKIHLSSDGCVCVSVISCHGHYLPPLGHCNINETFIHSGLLKNFINIICHHNQKFNLKKCVMQHYLMACQ